MVASHQNKISKDEIIHQFAEYILQNNCSIDRAISDFAKQAFESNFKMWLSGSIYTGFFGNSQNFLMQKIIKVNFGSNANMLTGNLVHLGRDIAVKHKIAHGELPNINICIRAMKVELNKEYQFLNPDELKNNSKLEIFILACKLFKVYFKEVLLFDTCIASEVSMNVDIPLEMFKDTQNANKFALTGIADGVYTAKDGSLGISDLKTSSKIISGFIEMDSKLEIYFAERKEIISSIENCDKAIKKLSDIDSKLKKAKSTLDDVSKKLEAAKTNNKPTLQLEKRLNKWTLEVDVLKEKNILLEETTQERLSLYKKLSELNEIIKPLKEIFDKEKEVVDLEACKKAHEAQLTHYALTYMI
ncbi:MAG: hypothetical protein U9P72_02090, partial [Campylobacterota bacterium]|nr:hypothetical protein [Campylobacterota bacterium]